MRNWWIFCALVLFVSLPVLAQSGDYQAGKITNVEKQASKGGGSYGGTDAAVKSDVDTYNISIQVGDTVFVCRYQSRSDQELFWIQGKDVQVKVAGKKMYVKRVTGKDAKGSILSSSKATAP
jgi:hypothetical protein